MTLQEYFLNDRFAAIAGCEIVEVGEGTAKVRMMVSERIHNAAGVCQGGAIFTLADFALAVAINSRGKKSFSINANICFHKAVKEGWLYATAIETKNNRRVPFARVEVTDESGELIATLSGQAYRFDEPILTE